MFESLVMVRPEHLNHHGSLFGGQLLLWLDEQAYMVAMAQFTDEKPNLVTVGIDKVNFEHGVKKGAILLFRSVLAHYGETSLTIYTRVFESKGYMSHIFDAYVSFVRLVDGKPFPVKDLLVDMELTPYQRAHWAVVEKARLEKAKAYLAKLKSENSEP